MPVKQARNCRISDIILYKNKESRMITDIDHRGKAYLICTTTLAGENPHFDTYNATDEVKVRGTQEVLL